MTIPIHVPFKELDSDWLLRGRRSLPVYVYFIIFCNKLRWVELVLFGGDPINAVCVPMRCNTTLFHMDLPIIPQDEELGLENFVKTYENTKISHFLKCSHPVL